MTEFEKAKNEFCDGNDFAEHLWGRLKQLEDLAEWADWVQCEDCGKWATDPDDWIGDDDGRVWCMDCVADWVECPKENGRFCKTCPDIDKCTRDKEYG